MERSFKKLNKNVFFFWVFIFIGGAFLCLEASAASESSLFQQGAAAFEEGRMKEAQELFLSAVQKNPKSAEGFYNLGAAYQQLKEPVKAAAGFRQALLLQNWFFGKRFSAQKALAAMGSPPPVLFLVPFEAVLIILWICLALFLFSFRVWKLVLFAAVLLIGGYYFYERSFSRWTVIQSAKALSSPYETASSVFTLKAGDWVKELDVKDHQWIQIESENQGRGWVPLDKLF